MNKPFETAPVASPSTSTVGHEHGGILNAWPYNAKVLGHPMPERIRRLPVSPTGFPIPWFVAWIDGRPDFRVADQRKLGLAWNKKLCWVCGQELGKRVALVLGPMCAVNRTVSEPPSHRECATYSAIVCPFLSNPRTRRNVKELPDERIDPPGHHLDRNPGAAGVWVIPNRGIHVFRTDENEPLFSLDDPLAVEWYAEGRPASRDEVAASINAGLPQLLALATSEAEREGILEGLKETQKYLPDPRTGAFYAQ